MLTFGKGIGDEQVGSADSFSRNTESLYEIREQIIHCSSLVKMR
jgi:hypothetical protein